MRSAATGLTGCPSTSAASGAGVDNADVPCSFICMRTTLNLDEALVAEAIGYSGVKEKTALLHEGLRALIQREAAGRLAALGGKDRRATAAPRRKAAPRR